MTFNPVDSFISSSTHRLYKSVFFDSSCKYDCSTSNCIYLITCSNCKLQYVGETSQTLRHRFATHRQGINKPNTDVKCRRLSDHFNIGICKNKQYTVQIIETLEGSGKLNNGSEDISISRKRREKEKNYMLTLRTVYPYGLNDRIGDEYSRNKSEQIGNRFKTLKRNKIHPPRNHLHKKSSNIPIDFVGLLSNMLLKNLPDAMNFIRFILSHYVNLNYIK